MNGELGPRNDNNFWLKGLTDEATDLPVNDATVSWEVRTAKQPSGIVLLSGSGSYVAATDGNYRCDVPASDLLIPGTKYVRRVIAISSVGRYDRQHYFTAVDLTGLTPTT